VPKRSAWNPSARNRSIARGPARMTRFGDANYIFV
jgi:hypothetical protein